MPRKRTLRPFLGEHGKPVSCLCGACARCYHRGYQRERVQNNKLRGKNQPTDDELERRLVEKFERAGWD